MSKKSSKKPARNNKSYDKWSLIHVVTGIILGWLMNPYVGLAGMILWEPVENLIISPILIRRGNLFGYESLRNSLSDVFFDVVGVYIGWVVLTDMIVPPFHLL
jgi:hypothetical protein